MYVYVYLYVHICINTRTIAEELTFCWPGNSAARHLNAASGTFWYGPATELGVCSHRTQDTELYGPGNVSGSCVNTNRWLTTQMVTKTRTLATDLHGSPALMHEWSSFLVRGLA